jgi:hypothetical protein
MPGCRAFFRLMEHGAVTSSKKATVLTFGHVAEIAQRRTVESGRTACLSNKLASTTMEFRIVERFAHSACDREIGVIE